MANKRKNNGPELRQDLTSGDWVLFSPKRSYTVSQNNFIEKQPKKDCPFENPRVAGGGEIIASYPEGGLAKWRIQVIPNKSPAVQISSKIARRHGRKQERHIEGYGHHEVVITRDHDDNFSKLSIEDANLLFRVFKDRYQTIARDKNTDYISIFHNWGPKTGASVYHPHYQILSMPVVPPLSERSLLNARRYHRRYGGCAHCAQIESARKSGKRVLYENELAIVFTPYAPKEPFELRVSPRGHTPFFEKSTEYEINSMVKALQFALNRLEKKIKNINYNFYLRTPPVKERNKHAYYHWHVQIVPRLNAGGGFELTTGMEINPVVPEEAIAILKGER
jgi:UDPglucose--hexose-1-phosphate uridylyltransferase